MKSVIASHFKCFLPHSLVISVIFLLSTQPVQNCIEFQFGESQCNKRRNLQIDHKSSYGCSTDIEAQVETMTHMFQHDQYLLEIVRDLNGYFRLCEKSVRFQIEWTERRKKNNNNCWNMCKSIVISYFYGRSFISQWHIGIGIFFSSMILFRLVFSSIFFPNRMWPMLSFRVRYSDSFPSLFFCFACSLNRWCFILLFPNNGNFAAFLNSLFAY